MKCKMKTSVVLMEADVSKSRLILFHMQCCVIFHSEVHVKLKVFYSYVLGFFLLNLYHNLLN